MKYARYLEQAVRASSLAAALLVPLVAMPESQLQSAAEKTVSAVAHVDFKIVIPKVLSMDIDALPGARAAPMVSIMSNSHNVMLTASLRVVETALPSSDAHRNLILSAGARRSVAETAVCAPSTVSALRQVVCTASMP